MLRLSPLILSLTFGLLLRRLVLSCPHDFRLHQSRRLLRAQRLEILSLNTWQLKPTTRQRIGTADELGSGDEIRLDRPKNSRVSRSLQLAVAADRRHTLRVVILTSRKLIQLKDSRANGL